MSRRRSWDPLTDFIESVAYSMGVDVANRVADILGLDSPSLRGPKATGRKRAPTVEPPSTPYSLLGVLPTAPRSVVEAAYRALVKSEHPDVGGSADRMRGITGAMERIRRERRWK